MSEGIGKTELLVIAVISLVFFGGKKLPQLGRGLGDAIHEFRKAFSEEEQEQQHPQKKSKKKTPKTA